MKLRTALLAGIGLIGGACLMPLAAGAQTNTANTPSATNTAPGINNSGAMQKPAGTGSAAATGTTGTPSATSSGMSGTTGSTMGANTPPTGSNSATSGSTTMGSNMSSDDVSKLQQALNDNGESIKVDGVMGPQTQSALRDYQQKNGLQASGELDSQTRQKLNLGG